MLICDLCQQRAIGKYFVSITGRNDQHDSREIDLCNSCLSQLQDIINHFITTPIAPPPLPQTPPKTTATFTQPFLS